MRSGHDEQQNDGVALLNRKAIGYKLAPMLLTFIVVVGLTVVAQSIAQTSMGIVIPIRELIGLVVSFVVLGIIATVMNINFMKYIESEER